MGWGAAVLWTDGELATRSAKGLGGSSVGVLDSIGGREWRFGVDGRLPCFDLGMQAMDGDE